MKHATCSRAFFPAALLLSTVTFCWGLVDQPIVVHPIHDITVAAGTSQTVIPLNDVFRLDGVNGPVARFDTSQGGIDVELLRNAAPETVTNFLKYVNRGSYSGTFIHESLPDFVLQGGGYKLVDGQTETVPADAPVKNEFKLSNTRGTLAMASLSGDPDSATTQWFFNESDSNSARLDQQNGGFTVFGDIVGQRGLRVMDKIGALATRDFGSPFDHLPVVDYMEGEPVTNKNLVVVHSIKVLPLIASSPTGKALLKLAVSKNTNTAVVKTSFSGKNLILKYPGMSGVAVISVTAAYTGGAGRATTTFRVTKGNP